MNSEWPRRVFIAASKHFQNAATIPFFIEGTDYTPEAKYLEFRLDGPTVKQYNNDYYELDFMVEIMWTLAVTHDDFHEVQRIIGMITEAMTNICVLNGDGTFLGTLARQNPIKTANFGRINAETGILQGTVFADYKICLTEG